MRKESVMEDWRVAGRITGAGRADVVQEVNLPFCLADLSAACGRDGLFLRGWELSRVIERPKEPPHSHAERTLLQLDGVVGVGTLLVDGMEKCALAPRMEVDMSEEMRAGSCHVTLRFPPRLPTLFPGEHGADLPVETAVRSAQVRNVYLLRIEEIALERDTVRVRVYAYGAGKVRVCFRLTEGEGLLWSENLTTYVRVGAQVIERVFVPSKECRCAQMRVTIDMGGEGCDEAVALYVCLKENPRAFAHFRALPAPEMLQGVKQAGFDGIVLHGAAPVELMSACGRMGLHLRCAPPALDMRVLLRQGAEEEVKEGECLCAPVLADGEREAFLQAQKLCRAAAILRAEGRLIHLLAWGRQMDAQDGLFDGEGKPRTALYALRNVLGRVSVFTRGDRKLYYPYAEFAADVILCAKEADGGAAEVRAQLFLWNGTEVASRSFTASLHSAAQEVGVLRAQLPWECRDGLVLRLQCWRGGILVAQNHAYYACVDENGEKRPFPLADVTEGIEGGTRVLYNASHAVAAGVTVLCGGKALLRHGALLPLERIELAWKGEVVVKYGNPIEKGGAAVVSQRILRGVFPHSDTAPADSQAGNQ